MTQPAPPPQLDRDTLAHVTAHLVKARRKEAPRLSEIHEYVKNRIIDFYVPEKATVEYRQLVDQSRFNVLPLLISSVANNLFVDGYRPDKQAENAQIWDAVWQPNRMDARQSGLWRASLQYGTAYATVVPGELNGKKSAVITPWSPRRCTALYADVVNDEWPVYAMTVGTPRPVFSPQGVTMVTPVSVYDDNWRYDMDLASGLLDVPVYQGRNTYSDVVSLGDMQIDTTQAKPFLHNMGFVPIVRFLENRGDLDEAPEGIIYPVLPAQRRLNQTSFGLGMTELYEAFRQRYVVGMEIQEDENGNPIEPFDIAVDRLLHAADPDVKFGEFSQADLDGYLNSRDKTLLYISSVRQLLPHTLVVGNAVSNISAEALAALAAGHGQDVAEHQTGYGEDVEQTLRAAGKASGDKEAWEDTSAQVRWRDTTPRSLAQIADALGKLAVQLGIPARGLWERIPGVTQQDLKLWDKLAKESDSFGKLEGLMNGGSRGTRAAGAAPAGNGGGSAAGVPASAGAGA